VRRSCLFFCFFIFFFFQLNAVIREITSVPWHEAIVVNAFDDVIIEPFVLNALSYDVDIDFDRDEFAYLVDLKKGDRITAQICRQVVCNVAKKKKISGGSLRFTTHGDGSKDLHVHLVTHWTFKKLIINGISIGRDAYSHYYTLEPGEVFNKEKHEHSMRKIKEFLHNQGYFNGSVTDSFAYDNRTKSITAIINLNLGKPFKINSCSICFDPPTSGVSSDPLVSLKNRIDKLFSRYVCDKNYTQDLIDKQGKEIKKLMVERGFFSPEIHLEQTIDRKKRQVDLDFSVTVQQKKIFVFNGNRFFSHKQLLDAILSFESSISLLPASLLAQELEQLYYRHGFLNIIVEGIETDDRYLFTINEGPRALIDTVTIVGAHTFDSSVLINNYGAAYKKPSFFNVEYLKSFLDALIGHYHKEGFWDAKIINYAVNQNAGGDGYTVVITIEEGPRYFLSSLSIDRFPELTSQGPFAALAISEGKKIPFDVAALTNQRRWLVDYLHKNGYLYNEVKPELTIVDADNKKDKLISVVWHVRLLQEQVRFGKTIFVGINKIPFHKLLRELCYEQGDVWNKEKLSATLTRFKALELFDTVQIYPENSATPEPIKPVIIKLIEDDPFEIRLRAGVLGVAKNFTWREGATYKVGGSFLHKNPFNSGGLFCIDGDITLFERRISGFYRYPWLFGRPYKTLIKGYSNKYIQPVMIGKHEPLYLATQQGFLVGVSHKHEQTTFGCNIGVEWMETSLKNRIAAAAINFSPALVDVKIPYFYVEPSVVFDRLDDKLNPTRGLFTVASIKAMWPFSRTKPFLKMLFEQSFFYPLSHRVIGCLHIRAGHVFNQLFCQIMPPERFFLGGAYSLRGYQPDFAPPLGCYIDCGGKRQYVPQGGKSMVNINMELRFPVWGKMNGALFQDAGLLVGDSLTSSIKDAGVAATGLGLRYNTPVGPLRFDVGAKWKKYAASDSRFAWFLTLGHAF
jgi:outer membrane protein insertion porin family